ncbi:substrate-binding domain-containing protein [Rickettsiales bacterium]|nr:substrate-binding domain-containing protein [Rickettsiales bacterium]
MAQKSDKFIIIQSTTSTRDSGFYDYIIEKFKNYHPIDIRVIAVGTGQALRNAKKCDADILLVHHKPSEDEFVRKGYGLYRKQIMYNDYVLVGPKNDPANIKQLNNIKGALKRIYQTKSFFVTRGDESGTDKKEKSLWRSVRLTVDSKKNNWYLESGSGMGSSLNIAVNKNAYILTDRSTWISFGNKKGHIVLVENEPSLFNYYGIIPISPLKCPKSKLKESETFINWLLSKEGKEYINSFKKDGKQLFFSSPREY